MEDIQIVGILDPNKDMYVQASNLSHKCDATAPEDEDEMRRLKAPLQSAALY